MLWFSWRAGVETNRRAEWAGNHSPTPAEGKVRLHCARTVPPLERLQPAAGRWALMPKQGLRRMHRSKISH